VPWYFWLGIAVSAAITISMWRTYLADRREAKQTREEFEKTQLYRDQQAYKRKKQEKEG
jgi:hypothetical protein